MTATLNDLGGDDIDLIDEGSFLLLICRNDDNQTVMVLDIEMRDKLVASLQAWRPPLY